MLLARLRTLFLPACLAALAVLAASFQLDNMLGLVPCPLRLSQRLLLALYALLSLASVLQAPRARGLRRYAWATLACSLGGAALAARQVWLQGAERVVDACPLPIGRVFEQGWVEAARQLLFGGPECSALSWSFLDLTLPEWSLLAFLLLAALPASCLLAYRFRTLAGA
ncbi:MULTISPECIES: disulfide bond formation protein B [Pseudomonas]|jgi:disulfide bond formation protein DsbB|uniref:Disulfide bond formation protein B n=1 Tax=Pseudomonas juntendi TaxID=2666183 RepID=A0A7W2QAX2_9PSED|nr:MULTISPECIES: disulfide bond formation protein B [Pseudomonas]EGB99965.1 disulfide bond formation protein [Pseudomonas sp. TJI-51]MBA6099687.1 disulfide bond formation protein B [Pseudomonas juntendi]MBA6122457.1 disulfide bond formation protein B [Pseudomonas juntendi]MBH3385921.1 disulfide bond formation protein B [Pseudomonas juntendi]MBI6914094.1 disulfide bond formation protein B [Pseudomonas juntendi]